MLGSDYWPSPKQIRDCEDPIIDRVAIERALEGDVKIMPLLTAREREALLEAICDLKGTSGWYRRWRPIPEHVAGGVWVMEPCWTLAQAWGMDSGDLWGRIQYRLNARAKRRQRAQRQAKSA